MQINKAQVSLMDCKACPTGLNVDQASLRKMSNHKLSFLKVKLGYECDWFAEGFFVGYGQL